MSSHLIYLLSAKESRKTSIFAILLLQSYKYNIYGFLAELTQDEASRLRKYINPFKLKWKKKQMTPDFCFVTIGKENYLNSILGFYQG